MFKKTLIIICFSSLFISGFSQSQSQVNCESEFFQSALPNARIVKTERLKEPSHCRVEVKIQERISAVDQQAYAIGFEMRLPTNWNQRFLFQGNGGNDGRIIPAFGASANHSESALSRGFAVISTDAGHQSKSLLGGASFGIDPQARLNYGYQASQVLTPLAKKIIGQYYKEPPQYSYFMGCSNGGRHAMVAASRLANEFDGFIAGNPGFNLPKAAIQHAWDIQALSTIDQDITRTITQQDLNVLSQGILSACDNLDGIKDGMVQALNACQHEFGLTALECKTENEKNCISSLKVSALNKMFSGPRNSKNEQLYTDWPYDVGVNGADWQRWKIKSPIANLPMIATLGAGSLAEIFQTPPQKIEPTPDSFLAYLRQFDFDQDAASIFSTTDRYNESSFEFMTPPHIEKLGSLNKHNSKLLVYHGASDGVFSVNDTIHWYQSLSKTHNNQAQGFARLFVVPGMNHCAGGPATDKFDALSAMIEWVEKDKAPDAILASVNPDNTELPSNWSKERSRPLCPYPKIARYIGEGDTENADSFYCQ